MTPPPLFLYYFAYCRRPARVVERALTGHRGDVSSWAESAYRDGEELLGRLHPWPGHLPEKEVRFELGEPVLGNGISTVPVAWTATHAPRLFPQMAAELTIEPIGSENTQLTFRGSYRPPLGAVGRALDRALLHRVAERTVKTFVDGLADRLEAWDQPTVGTEI